MRLPEREVLRERLAAAGFDEVRFAAAATRSSDGSPGGGFGAWLAAGNHADMSWLERNAGERVDPQRVLPGARTVIALGVNCLPDGPAASQRRWAKYALHEDYHDGMRAGLEEARRALEQFCGLTRDDSRVYVDTGPVLERGWAAAAGLGWQGKNGMLISRRHGNWLLLAAILTRAAIPPDPPLGAPKAAPDGAATIVPGPAVAPPMGRLCGSCNRCLRACPTQAFPRPGWVDARRCISYHTIENRGIVPRELRAGFGGRVFGCDVCLDVCPWNRFAQAGRSRLLAVQAEIAGLDLIDLLTMTGEQYRAVFRKTPVQRARHAGLLRNACIAAGNWHDSVDWHFGKSGDPTAVAEAVLSLCRHESEVVRAHAVWALVRLIGPALARARAAEPLAQERSDTVLAEWRAAGF